MKNKHKIISIIPARSGSVGLKDKNIKKINNIHLIGYSILCSIKSKLISNTFVSTNSDKYINIAQKYGAETPFKRPLKYSKSNSNDYDLISHAINFFDNINFDFDYIVFLRPTTPKRNVNIINKAISKFVKSNYDSLRSVHEMSESSFKSFRKNKETLLPLIKNYKDFDLVNNPRQSFEKTFVGNGYIDIFRRNYVKKYKKLYGKNVMAFETNYVTEVDNINDFNYLKFLMEK